MVEVLMRHRLGRQLAVGVQRMRMELRLEPLAVAAERVRPHVVSSSIRRSLAQRSSGGVPGAATLARDADRTARVVGAAGPRGPRGRLAIAGRDAEGLAREHGTPMYVHDLVAASEQAERLRDAFVGAGLDARVRLALKAQRDPVFLGFLREAAPFVGMDVCSPGEVDWALRARLGAGGDQLHRHEPVRPRPRPHPGDRAST